MGIVFFIAIFTTLYYLNMSYIDYINAINNTPYNEKETIEEGKIKITLMTIASITWAIILC